MKKKTTLTAGTNDGLPTASDTLDVTITVRESFELRASVTISRDGLESWVQAHYDSPVITTARLHQYIDVMHGSGMLPTITAKTYGREHEVTDVEPQVFDRRAIDSGIYGDQHAETLLKANPILVCSNQLPELHDIDDHHVAAVYRDPANEDATTRLIMDHKGSLSGLEIWEDRESAPDVHAPFRSGSDWTDIEGSGIWVDLLAAGIPAAD
ncbi:hypothetical protein ASG92_20705 [Arthrobacter sp. Soil736]|uniref:hypothetical protein n=1 Tax=Arthrobacter sp. Soil736 TaxID=1736395 RepID=UPI0006F1F268|nr:hypothetical protein [Arthrobacter sp. Soil736]KRE61802.1 hypothetical protein ASG92_20705 [Arthrobacter sp. Soil736]